MADIAPFSLKGRFWRGNLHTHSNLSDGALPLDRAVEAYKDAGYDFVQMSEHFIDRYRWPIADTRPFRSNRFTTLIGAELHAMATEVGELWHIVAAGLPLDFEPPAPDETGPNLRLAPLRRELSSASRILPGRSCRSRTAMRSKPPMRSKSTIMAASSKSTAAMDGICSISS